MFGDKNVLCYLNNAATAYPRPQEVIDAMREEISNPPISNDRSTWGVESTAVDYCRTALADFMGVNPAQVILTTGATIAANIAVWGLAVRQGIRAVCTVAEHNAVLRPLRHAVARTEGSLMIVGLESTGDIDIVELESVVDTHHPNLVVATHASNVTGRVFDVETVFRIAHEVGAITLLDASQSIGRIPVYPRQLGADITIITGHKGLLGPPGTGGMVVLEPESLGQVLVGGTGSRSDMEYHPTELPYRFEAGTYNDPGFAGLTAALHWHRAQDSDILSSPSRMAGQMANRLREIPGVHVLGHYEGSFNVGIVSVVVDGFDVNELGYILRESFEIVTRAGLHCTPLIHRHIGASPEGTLRFSTGPFTTERHVDMAISAMRSLVPCAF